MIRLLHLSDVHLGARYDDFGAQADMRRQEVLDAFRGLTQVADAAAVDAVLIAGDLFDSPTPSDYTLSVVRQTLRRLVDAGRPVFVIPGNSDAITCNPQLYAEQLGGAYIFRDPVFRAPVSVETAGGPLHVYGLAYDWARPEPLETYRRADAPGTHVILAHACTSAMPNWRWYPNALRLPAGWLRSVEADYIALGDSHWHRPPESFEGDRVPACYPGAFAATDLTETGPRGWVIASIEPGERPRVVLDASRARPIFDVGEFDVTGAVSEEGLATALVSNVPTGAIPTVTLVGELSFPLQSEALQARLEQRFGCAKVHDHAWYASSSRLDMLTAQDTIAGHVLRLGRMRIDEAPVAEDQAAAEVAERALRLALRTLRVDG